MSPQLAASLLDMGLPQQVGSRAWSGAVAERVMWMAQGDQQFARLSLNPPQLGPLEVRVTINQEQASITFLSSHAAVREALDMLAADGRAIDYMRIRSFPFGREVQQFIDAHEQVFVVEQNRDAQLRTLLILDADGDPKKLVPLLHYNGMPINAGFVVDGVLKEISKGRAA